MIRAQFVFLSFLAVIPAVLQAAQPRLSSDFELQAARDQLRAAQDPSSRIAAHLNLGDVEKSRGDVESSREQFSSAAMLARTTAAESRTRGHIESYARMTAWSGMAMAKLGLDVEAVGAFEESIRYLSDSPAIWNLYASAMTVLGRSDRAISFAANAVAVAPKGTSASEILDLDVYKYSLASALLAKNDSANSREAQKLLEEIDQSLDGKPFSRIRNEIARNEQFEIFSTASGDGAAYLSLWNRSHLRLGQVYETGGHTADARLAYRKVLVLRTDDAEALTGMARLAVNAAERDDYFRAAFSADPFSFPLLNAYRNALAGSPSGLRSPDGDSPGARLQRAVLASRDGRSGESDRLLKDLDKEFGPQRVIDFLLAKNAAARGDFEAARSMSSSGSLPEPERAELRSMVRNADAGSRHALELLVPAHESPRLLSPEELQSLIALFRSPEITAEQRTAFDATAFHSTARFAEPVAKDDSTTTFSSGNIGSIPFRFSSPTRFQGTYDGASALDLEFRILGLSEEAGREIVLLEPIRLTGQSR